MHDTAQLSSKAGAYCTTAQLLTYLQYGVAKMWRNT